MVIIQHCSCDKQRKAPIVLGLADVPLGSGFAVRLSLVALRKQTHLNQRDKEKRSRPSTVKPLAAMCQGQGLGRENSILGKIHSSAA